MTTIGLAMLVKDEAEVLPATLERIVPAIDAWTVIDTGSVDDSNAIIRSTLGHLPGGIVRRPFDGFGSSRTALLGFAKERADYTLMLDADHTLHIHDDRPSLEADSYLVKVEGNLEWRLPLLTSNTKRFKYRGAAHAYLACDEPASRENTDWISVDGGGGVTREKLERDRVLLEQSFNEDPSDARTAFYLAQTYKDLDMHDKAIAMYRLRTTMGGWDQEIYYSRYMLGCLLSDHISFAQGASELLEAWYRRPTRAESLRALAVAANHVADKIQKPDELFVTPSAYKEQD